MEVDCIADSQREGIGSAVTVNSGLTVVAVEPLACADDIVGRGVVAD